MHKKGIAGLFNGVIMNLIYMTSARGIYFALFDSYKDKTTSEPLKWLWSYISITLSLFVNYPLDTVRKRVIVAPDRHASGRACFRYMLREEGVGSLLNGWRIVGLLGINFSCMLYLYDRMFT